MVLLLVFQDRDPYPPAIAVKYRVAAEWVRLLDPVVDGLAIEARLTVENSERCKA